MVFGCQTGDMIGIVQPVTGITTIVGFLDTFITLMEVHSTAHMVFTVTQVFMEIHTTTL